MNAKTITGTGIAAIIASLATAFATFSEYYVIVPIRHFGVYDTYDPEAPR